MSVTTVSATAASHSVEPMYGKVVLRKGPRGFRAKPQAPVSRDAQRVAAVILEVLAGVRTPTEAAAAVSLSLPRYYLWEQRALEGLVRACEPRLKGKAVSERHQIAALENEVVRLRQDCSRQQALVRASHRTIGLAGPPQGTVAKPATKPGGKAAGKAGVVVANKARRKRRPVARALKAVAALQAVCGESESLADSSSAIAADPSAIVADVVQRSVPNSSVATAEAACAAAAVVEA